MSKTPLLFATLLITAVLSGCTDSPAPSMSSSPAPSSTAFAPTRQQNATRAPVAPATELVAIAFDGQIPAGGCLPSGPGTCQGTPALASTASKTFPKTPVSLWSADLNVTWTAATPTTTTLTLQIQPYKSCGTTCIESTNDGLHVTGTSPLRLTGAFYATTGAEGVWVHVRVPMTATPAGLQDLHGAQDVHVEGKAWATP